MVEVLDYCEPQQVEGIPLELRLTFRGKVPKSPRLEDKTAIRKALHPQLAEYWNHSPFLRSRGQAMKTEYCDRFFKEVSHSNHIWRFLPLIGENNSTSCSLDILFLRRDFPGGTIQNGGDIDNRLKVVFDALRMPHGPQEVEDRQPESEEDPLYCLLEDDKYIDKVTVTTDRLLTPRLDGEHVHDVMLVIHVKTTVFGPGYQSFWCAY
jgi:hypothetical protein